MDLQGRDLRLTDPHQTGADMQLLQTELRLLGYKITDDDVEENLFGPSTRDAARVGWGDEGTPTTTTSRLHANGFLVGGGEEMGSDSTFQSRSLDSAS